MNKISVRDPGDKWGIAILRVLFGGDKGGKGQGATNNLGYE